MPDPPARAPSRGGVLESGGVPAILRVTDAAAAPVRPAMRGLAPSPLLARMEEFLPQLRAANEALAEAGRADGCVEIVAPAARGAAGVERSVEALDDAEADVVVGEEDDAGGDDDDVGTCTATLADGDESSSEEEDEGDGEGGIRAVHMDLYVDNTLGELVASENYSPVKSPLIVEVPNGANGGPDKTQH